jgi:hypothetical protein
MGSRDLPAQVVHRFDQRVALLGDQLDSFIAACPGGCEQYGEITSVGSLAQVLVENFSEETLAELLSIALHRLASRDQEGGQ